MARAKNHPAQPSTATAPAGDFTTTRTVETRRDRNGRSRKVVVVRAHLTEAGRAKHRAPRPQGGGQPMVREAPASAPLPEAGSAPIRDPE